MSEEEKKKYRNVFIERNSNPNYLANLIQQADENAQRRGAERMANVIRNYYDAAGIKLCGDNEKIWEEWEKQK